MSEPRTIKKYPNRRLYDTVESRYITLADIRLFGYFFIVRGSLIRPSLWYLHLP